MLFLKEPGKALSLETKNEAPEKLQEKLTPGQELKLKLKGDLGTLSFSEEVVTHLDHDPQLIEKISHALAKGIEIKFYVTKRTKVSLEILVRANKSIFLGKSQLDIKPFTKHEEVLEEDLRREPESGDDTEESPLRAEENTSETSTEKSV